jgi:hypothetical protein
MRGFDRYKNKKKIKGKEATKPQNNVQVSEAH